MKGAPRRNFVDLCGRPLIVWSIESGMQLLSSGVLVCHVFSTDDDEFPPLPRVHYADVQFLRPIAAATDKAKALT
jgi:CMP-N-acetylneuraminic acid synthetase